MSNIVCVITRQIFIRIILIHTVYMHQLYSHNLRLMHKTTTSSSITISAIITLSKSIFSLSKNSLFLSPSLCTLSGLFPSCSSGSVHVFENCFIRILQKMAAISIVKYVDLTNFSKLHTQKLPISEGV